MTKASVARKLKQYEVGGFQFANAGDPDGYDRHLVFDHAISRENASQLYRELMTTPDAEAPRAESLGQPRFRSARLFSCPI